MESCTFSFGLSFIFFTSSARSDVPTSMSPVYCQVKPGASWSPKGTPEEKGAEVENLLNRTEMN